VVSRYIDSSNCCTPYLLNDKTTEAMSDEDYCTLLFLRPKYATSECNSPMRQPQTVPYLWRTPRRCYGFQQILCKAIEGLPESVRLPARIMLVSHNPCTPLAQVVGKKFAQPGTSCCPVQPRAFGIGPKTVNRNNASIDRLVSVYYLDKVLRTKYTLYYMTVLSPAGEYVFVDIRFALWFVQYFQWPATCVLSRTSNPKPTGEECCWNEGRSKQTVLVIEKPHHST
jgi:hypothetical protein